MPIIKCWKTWISVELKVSNHTFPTQQPSKKIPFGFFFMILYDQRSELKGFGKEFQVILFYRLNEIEGELSLLLTFFCMYRLKIFTWICYPGAVCVRDYTARISLCLIQTLLHRLVKPRKYEKIFDKSSLNLRNTL